MYKVLEVLHNTKQITGNSDSFVTIQTSPVLYLCLPHTHNNARVFNVYASTGDMYVDAMMGRVMLHGSSPYNVEAGMIYESSG